MGKLHVVRMNTRHKYTLIALLGALTSVLIWFSLHDTSRPLRNAVPSEAATSWSGSALAALAVLSAVFYPALSAVTIFRRRTADGVSSAAWLLVLISAIIWLGYGTSVGDVYQVAANAAIAVCALGVLFPLLRERVVTRNALLSVAALSIFAFLTTLQGNPVLSLVATTSVTVMAGVATLASVLSARTTKGVSVAAIATSVTAQILWIFHGVNTAQPVLIATGVSGAILFALSAAALVVRRTVAKDLDVAAAAAMRHVSNAQHPTAALYPVFSGAVCVSVSCRASNAAWKAASLDVSGVDGEFLAAVAEAYRKGHAAVPDNDSAALIRVGPEAVFLYVMPGHSGAEGDSSSLEGQVFERTEMARELHDHILSDLHVTGMLLERAAAAKGLSPSEAANMNARLAHLSGGIRSIIDGRPLESHGPLTVELSDLVAVWNASTTGSNGLKVVFEQAGTEPHISDHAHYSVLAVVKEAVTNAARHASASRVTIRLETVHPGGAGMFDGLEVSVSDDGKGMSELNARTSVSGLSNMQKRIADIGGRMTHFSPIGRPGTTISFSVPSMALESDPVLVQ